ncbi:uncharacterized protein [Prorops nasuta]|uniref:uncharacterized protein n=1 Tax=Prorops nasuta TaxID=863751 RepID=UPI0034CE4027
MGRTGRSIIKPARYQDPVSPEVKRRKRNSSVTGNVTSDIEYIRNFMHQQNENMSSLRETLASQHNNQLNTQSNAQINTQHNIQTNTQQNPQFHKLHNLQANTIQNPQINAFRFVEPIHTPNNSFNNNCSFQSEPVQSVYPQLLQNYNSANISNSYPSISQHLSIMHEQNARNSLIPVVHPNTSPYPVGMESSTQDFNDRIMKRLDELCAETKRINVKVDRIERTLNKRQRASSKPSCIPISSLEDMEMFENITETEFSDVVEYFEYTGGFNMKETVKLCLKEGLKDSATVLFTWNGTATTKALCQTRFVKAIYEALCNNSYFKKPIKPEFKNHLREALRGAKERLRHNNNTQPNSYRLRNNKLPNDQWDLDEEEKADDDI